MSKFTVRVELRSATEEDYEKLRMEMEDRGFSRLLPAGDGGKVMLPPDEYNLDAGWTPEQVLNTGLRQLLFDRDCEIPKGYSGGDDLLTVVPGGPGKPQTSRVALPVVFSL